MARFGSVREREFFLLPRGEYVLTLSELEETEGQWGDRMIFKFLVAPREDFSAYICRPNGDEEMLFVFTDRDIVLGATIHKLVEALTGEKFEKGNMPPSEDDLLGKRILAYVTHETPTRGKNAGQKRAILDPESIEPFKGPAKKIAPNVTRTEPPETEADRAAKVEQLGKLIGRAVKLETPNHAKYVALDLDDGDIDQLEQLIVTVRAEVQDAMDA